MQRHVDIQNPNHLYAIEDRPQVVLVTGYSGAGKNTVLHSLEDIGFYCIDNLPSALIQPFFQAVSQSEIPKQRIALGLDVRSDISKMISKLMELKRGEWFFSFKMVFVTSSHQVLLKRFQETRRKHPLADTLTDVSEAILKEQDLLQPLYEMADVIVDTDQFTMQQLRNLIIQSFAPNLQQHMVVTLTAFGFKYGVPSESNLVFDVRFLPNPHFHPLYKQMNGTDNELQHYLFEQKTVQEFWNHFVQFTTYVIQQSLKEGRFSMNIAIGCTGGRHRSVAFVHRFAQESIQHVSFLTRYRDMEKN